MSSAQVPAVITQAGTPTVRLLAWKPYRSGALYGYVDTVAGRALRINDIAVMCNANGKAWLAMPQKPVVTGTRVHLEADGRVKRTPVVEWIDRQAAQRFCDAVMAALLTEYPDALDGWASGS